MKPHDAGANALAASGHGLFAAMSGFLRGPRGESGATAVEFGLLTPIFATVFFGLVEFGRLLFALGVINFSAEEATRYATVNYEATTDEIRDVAESKFMMLDTGNITEFSVISDLNEVDQTKLVTVEIEYAFETLAPMGWGPIHLIGHSRGFIVAE